MPLFSALLLSLLADAAPGTAPSKSPDSSAPAAAAVEPGLVGQYFQQSDSLSEMPEIPKGQKPD
ncbi:MAG: hypothetical protein JNL10_03085, partial [Verrucomicrobiales bacterium]|nr:hypothetical protein [Verrucomicrobiales bacterium]